MGHHGARISVCHRLVNPFFYLPEGDRTCPRIRSIDTLLAPAYVSDGCTEKETVHLLRMIDKPGEFTPFDVRSYTIDHSTLCRLRDDVLLNDEIINAYFVLLQRRDTLLNRLRGSGGRSLFFNSFFFDKLLLPRERFRYTFANVARWKKCVVFRMTTLYLPLNLGNSHWVLVTVDIVNLTIHYWDPMGGILWRHIHGLRRWLGEEARDKGATDFCDKEWAINIVC